MERYPHAHATLLTALEELLNPTEIVILRGDISEIDVWRRELVKLYAPRRMILAVPSTSDPLPAALETKLAKGPAIAYVCRGSVCSSPIDSLSTLIQELRTPLASIDFE
jgi:uncharacterized protein YyaL (SSP411 family)